MLGLKVYDHGLQGSGISPDKPFEAIVLDRGGAIRGTHVDLYIGSENSGAIQKYRIHQPSADHSSRRYEKWELSSLGIDASLCLF